MKDKFSFLIPKILLVASHLHSLGLFRWNEGKTLCRVSSVKNRLRSLYFCATWHDRFIFHALPRIESSYHTHIMYYKFTSVYTNIHKYVLNACLNTPVQNLLGNGIQRVNDLKLLLQKFLSFTIALKLIVLTFRKKITIYASI